MSDITCQTATEILQLLWETFSVASAPTYLPHCIAHEMTVQTPLKSLLIARVDVHSIYLHCYLLFVWIVYRFVTYRVFLTSKIVQQSSELPTQTSKSICSLLNSGYLKNMDFFVSSSISIFFLFETGSYACASMEVGCTKHGLLYITRMVKRDDITTVSALKILFSLLQ